MSLTLLFVLGYLLAAIGSGVIVSTPVRRVLGFNDARHADPETDGDALIILIAVLIGVAAIWPVTITAYYATRFIPAQVD